MKKICSDLVEEYEALDALVAPLEQKAWELGTPFFDWTIFDQILHIAFFDHEALLTIEAQGLFQKRAENILGHVRSGQPWPKWTQAMAGIQTPDKLLPFWRDIRTRLAKKLMLVAPKTRLPWYGPDMSARSLASSRLMETWAHGQDIFDAFRKKRINQARLFHVAHMGVTTFKWSYRIRGLEPPAQSPRVLLSGPAGESWEWKEPGSRGEVKGSAEDFCLVVTQRRNLADTRLQWTGEQVGKWLSMAQVFAGIPQDPPLPGTRIVEARD